MVVGDSGFTFQVHRCSCRKFHFLLSCHHTETAPDICNSLVSDNGAGFTSVEFLQFCAYNGIKLIHSSPFHPASNGLAERAIQIVKCSIKKAGDTDDLETKLFRFLTGYHITPHSMTGCAPVELLMNLRLQSRLDLVQPSVQNRVLKKQEVVIDNKTARDNSFRVGGTVLAMNFAGGPKCMAGVLCEQLGPVTLLITAGFIA